MANRPRPDRRGGSRPRGRMRRPSRPPARHLDVVRGLGADDGIGCRWDASPFPSDASKAIPQREETLDMPRIAAPPRDEAPAESQPILDSVGVQLGFIPNLHRLMSLSPAALTGLIGLQGALSKTLDPRTRHAISLAVSEAN